MDHCLLLDHVGDSSYVYRYSATASKNFSHDFPPAKSFQPVTTQRMTNDSNSFYRLVESCCSCWPPRLLNLLSYLQRCCLHVVGR